MKDEFKKIEAILYNYPIKKIEIDNLKLELENMKDEYIGCGVIGYGEKIGSTNKFNSMVENEAEKRIARQNMLANKIKFKENELKKIENSLKILDERERSIVEMKYFKKYGNPKIAFELNVVTGYVTELKKNVIKKLIPVLLV